MTALELIREGYNVWAEDTSANGFRTPLMIFALLFLFGFLVTGIAKRFKIPKIIVADTQDSLSQEGRELIDDANTARLFELESELAASKETLRSFTETLSTTFANLSGGLAIFDADKSLYLFNPALSNLLDLDPVWLARRPSISDFISMLREKRHLPEKRNFLAWRRLLTELQDTGQQEFYDDEWSLPDGRILHVTGQPHPRGAVAFFFEDISASVARDRENHLEIKTYQSILDELSDAVVIIQPSGLAKFANKKFQARFDKDFCETLQERGIPELSKNTLLSPEVANFWSKIKTYVSTTSTPVPCKLLIADQSGADMTADVSGLPDGSTLVIIKKNAKEISETQIAIDVPSETFDPLNLNYLEDMLRQRNVSLDQSGFDLDCVPQADIAKLRRIMWYLVISASDSCRSGARLTLSSSAEGQSTLLSCGVSEEDRLDDVHESLAANLLKQLVDQPDTNNIWNYDIEADPFTVSYKTQLPLRLSAV
jgi:PAS domain-containing protein